MQARRSLYYEFEDNIPHTSSLMSKLVTVDPTRQMHICIYKWIDRCVNGEIDELMVE